MADNYIATVKKMRGSRDDFFFMKDIKEILSQYAREELEKIFVEECKKMELQIETIDKDKIDMPLVKLSYEDLCGKAE